MNTYQRKILIVEDDPFMGSLMADALESKGFTAKLAETALAAKRQLNSFDPDVVLVDIDLGDGPSGIDFIHVVSNSHSHIASILLSKHADSVSAGLSGVHIPEGVGYLRKSLVHNTDALIDSINEVCRGHAHNLRQDKASKGDLDLLTKSQVEILHMMALGFSNKEIAKQRGVSVSNIEQRVSEIFKAFNISQSDDLVPRVEAIRRYMRISGIPDRYS